MTGWVVMLWLAVAISVVFVPPYLTLNREAFFGEQRAVYNAHTFAIVAHVSGAVVAHVSGAVVALLLGPFQLLAALRRLPRRSIHRWIGRAYLGGVAVSGVFGFYMAWIAFAGPVAQIGFMALSIAWLYTAWRAYRAIRSRQVDTHRRWMIRNYALTFAAVTLRGWVGVSIATGLDFEASYRVIAWIAWVPNLLIVEWFVRQQTAGAPRPRPEPV